MVLVTGVGGFMQSSSYLYKRFSAVTLKGFSAFLDMRGCEDWANKTGS